MKNIKFFVIHNRDPLRKKVILNELNKNGVANKDIQFVEFPNKEELTYGIKKIAVQKRRNRHNYNDENLKGKSIKDGWICVSYKHYLALEAIVKNNYEFSVIVEDNIGKFNKNILETLNTCMEQLPSDWDIVFDSTWAHSYEFIGEGKVSKDCIVYEKSLNYTFNEYGKIVSAGGTKSAQFYFLNYNSAKKLYENYLPFNHAPDVWMNELFRFLNFKTFWIEPSITETRKNHTSSTNFSKKISLYKVKSKLTNFILSI